MELWGVVLALLQAGCMLCHMQVHDAVYNRGEDIILENNERTSGNVYEFHLVELRNKTVL